jgi:transcriptional regulator of acetoin/glycerol metabolism
VDERRLRHALPGQHEGNVLAVAAELGKRRMQVYRGLKRLDIDVERFRKR